MYTWFSDNGVYVGVTSQNEQGNNRVYTCELKHTTYLIIILLELESVLSIVIAKTKMWPLRIGANCSA